MTIATIQPNELHQLQNGGKAIELIDVRTPVEFAGVHANGAKNHPLDQLDPQSIMRSRVGDDPVYMICQMGGRSRKACEQFVAAGFPNVVNVEGGTALWQQQGLPVTKSDRPVMAMDRQVRIAAGSMVLLGIILASLLPTPLVGLCVAGFIGAGLVFSGVTNTCGMATVLAAMPWNRVKKSGEC